MSTPRNLAGAQKQWSFEQSRGSNTWHGSMKKEKSLRVKLTPSIVISFKWRVGDVLKWGESENNYSLARDLMQPVYSQEDDGIFAIRQ
jgi:hypothetical protein